MVSVELIQSLESHEDRVWYLAWNHTGNLLASCGSDKSIKIWAREGNTWVCKSTLNDQHQRTIRTVCWSPCGNFLAAASFDATVSIWDRRNGEFECVATLEGHENEVKAVAWSVSGEFLATCSRDKSVWIWEVEDEDYVCASVLSKHTQDVKNVIWHPTLNVVASCSYDDTINMYKEDGDDDWEMFDTLKAHTSTVWCIAFNKTGDRLVSCSDDKSIKIWQCYEPNNAEGITTTDGNPTWKNVCTLSGYHQRTVYSVDWNHETGMIVSASADDSIKVFQEDLEASTKNEPVFSMIAGLERAHLQDVNCVKWHLTDASLFASCSDDMSIKLWKIKL